MMNMDKLNDLFFDGFTPEDWIEFETCNPEYHPKIYVRQKDGTVRPLSDYDENGELT